MEESLLDFDELAKLAEDLPFEQELALGLEQEASKGLQHGSNALAVPLDSRFKVKKTRKQASNAQNCRRYREKRRMEEEMVYKDNLALKRERVEFQEKIAALETEVQALRGQGVVDLSKENELLKIEVEKHKRYIERVVSVTKDTPLQVETEEEQRILRSGIESATAHIVGIMYSSMCDSSWTVTNSFEVDGVVCTCRYQLLPTGCRFEEATRVNLRVDCQELNVSAEDVMDYVVRTSNDIESWATKFGDTPDAMYKDVALEVVHPKFACSDDEVIACVRCLAPKDKPEREEIFVHATKNVNLYSTAFVDKNTFYENPDCRLTPLSCKMLVGTTADIQIAKPGEADRLQRVIEIESEGYLVRSKGANTSSWTHIMSTPISSTDETSRILHEIPIDETGNVKQGYIDMWRKTVVDFAQQYSGSANGS